MEGNRKRDIVVRLPEDQRSQQEIIQSIPLRVGEFGMIALGEAVDIRTEKAVDPIRHSRTQRRNALMVSVGEGRDMEGFVHEATARIKKEVKFPEGYDFDSAAPLRTCRKPAHASPSSCRRPWRAS